MFFFLLAKLFRKFFCHSEKTFMALPCLLHMPQEEAKRKNGFMRMIEPFSNKRDIT